LQKHQPLLTTALKESGKNKKRTTKGLSRPGANHQAAEAHALEAFLLRKRPRVSKMQGKSSGKKKCGEPGYGGGLRGRGWKNRQIAWTGSTFDQPLERCTFPKPIGGGVASTILRSKGPKGSNEGGNEKVNAHKVSASPPRKNCTVDQVGQEKMWGRRGETFDNSIGEAQDFNLAIGETKKSLCRKLSPESWTSARESLEKKQCSRSSL